MTDFTLKILSHTITVREVEAGPLSDDRQIGSAAYMPGEISILKGLHPDVRGHTLVHEICHIIQFVLGQGWSEQEIDAMATGIFSLLKDNPGFVEDHITRSS